MSPIALQTPRGTTLRILLLALALGAGAVSPCAAQELSPESPEVQEAVKKALQYLSTSDDPRLGGKALMALSIYKATADPDNPKLKALVEEVMKMLASSKQVNEEIYSLGIGILMFVNLDHEKYRPQIERLINELLARQKPHGGWGYQAQATGDTSMTQYAVLSLWEADRAGYAVPVPVWEKVCNWLLRTQDPSGGFGYQGIESDGKTLVSQVGVRHSMCAAGLGSLFLCQDHLGIRVKLAKRKRKAPSTALKVIEKQEREQQQKEKLTDKIDAGRLAQAESMGEQWFQKNWAIKPQGVEVYLHYYLYALERYETFREAMGGSPENNAWYYEGAQLLMATQREDGGWTGHTSPPIDTAFSVLFLIRSTMKTLMKAPVLGAGSLIAGRGLPTDIRNVQVRNSKVVAEPLKAPADKLLSLLENSDDPDSARAAEGLFRLAEQADEATLNKHALRLRKLADSADPEARIAAVKALGRTRELDNVPTLLYALTDPDPDVVTATIDALRYISRRPPGSNGTDIHDETTRGAAISFWKKWYLSIRPDTIFDD